MTGAARRGASWWTVTIEHEGQRRGMVVVQTDDDGTTHPRVARILRAAGFTRPTTVQWRSLTLNAPPAATAVVSVTPAGDLLGIMTTRGGIATAIPTPVHASWGDATRSGQRVVAALVAPSWQLPEQGDPDVFGAVMIDCVARGAVIAAVLVQRIDPPSNRTW